MGRPAGPHAPAPGDHPQLLAAISVGETLSTLPRIVLASQSPARLKLLRAVGIEPDVMVSAVDETAIAAAAGWASPHDVSQGLAIAKAEVVAAELPIDHLIIGCDSVMEFDGIAYGKPANVDEARERLAQLSGSSGFLYTGHHVIWKAANGDRAASALTRTQVLFHELTAAEVEAYIATGEPLRVAGAYTLDALGGPFIKEIHGDATNVVGLSVPTLRRMFAELGLGWELVLQQSAQVTIQ